MDALVYCAPHLRPKHSYKVHNCYRKYNTSIQLDRLFCVEMLVTNIGAMHVLISPWDFLPCFLSPDVLYTMITFQVYGTESLAVDVY